MTAIEERIVANGHGALSPSYFCVHTTANTGATAENHASLWSRQPEYAVHLVSDWEKCLAHGAVRPSVLACGQRQRVRRGH